MAHLVTGYAGYAHVSSADDGAFNASFFGGGQYVMEFGNCFSGSIIDNNTVRILDGDGLMYGRHFRIEPNSHEDVAITTGTAGTNRIDIICMTYEKNAVDETEKCYLQVIKGTESSGTAVAPNFTDGNILEGATFNQMPLYKVTIEGVVLKKVEPMFETLASYEKLAEIYAKKFQAICEELKDTYSVDNVLKKTDVVDSFDSTDPTAPFSANKGRELFQSVSDGKALIASAITDMEVATDATATFAEMAEHIRSIFTGTDVSDTTAIASKVNEGEIFFDKNGKRCVGTRPAPVTVQSGSVTFMVSAAGHSGDTTYPKTTSYLVTFPKAFDKAPTVKVVPTSYQQYLTVTVSSVNQSSFIINALNSLVGSNNVTFNWSAQA